LVYTTLLERATTVEGALRLSNFLADEIFGSASLAFRCDRGAEADRIEKGNLPERNPSN